MLDPFMLLFFVSVMHYSRSQMRRLLLHFPSLDALQTISKKRVEDVFQQEKLPAIPEIYLNDPSLYLSTAEKEKEKLDMRGIRFLTAEAPDWPTRFSTLQDAPLWFFLKGSLPSESSRSVSIIGSRDASPYGLFMADYIATELAKNGVSIVSGMASGIDAAAQRAALNAGGKSFAILGSGINICYPRENFDLFDSLSQTPGCGIMSEFPLGANSMAWHFPDRNRLIAAFGDCLLLIEARNQRSGSMITVGQALEQGKEVFALPGRITDPMSLGCNELIQCGASPLLDPKDILDYFGFPERPDIKTPAASSEILTQKWNKEQKAILTLLKKEPCSPDRLIRETGLDIGTIMENLMDLEAKHVIRTLNGNHYAFIYR